MLSLSSTLVLVSDVVWNDQGVLLPGLVADALEIERRLPKGVNLDRERTRYSVCCQRIEDIVLDLAGPAVGLDQVEAQIRAGTVASARTRDPYADLLEQLRISDQPKPAEARLGCTFIPPTSIGPHLRALEEAADRLGCLDALAERRRLLGLARSHGCALIECLDSCQPLSQVARPTAEADADAHQRDTSVITEVGHSEEDRVPHSAQPDALYRVTQQIRAALTGGGTINFTNSTPAVVTESLRTFVYRDPSGGEPLAVPVVYSDGSEAAPFTLHVVAPAVTTVEDSERQLLRVALMSMRHLDMDGVVDMALLRNRTISQTRPLAETDALAYARASIFFERATAYRPLVQLFVTGFPPAVVGTLRALADTLVRHPGAVVMTPMFYFGSTFKEGRSWT